MNKDDDILLEINDLSSKIDDIISDDILSKMIMNNKDNGTRKTKPIQISGNDMNKEDDYISSESCSFSPSSMTRHNHWFRDSKYGNKDSLFDDSNVDDNDSKDNGTINITPENKVNSNNNENNDTIKRGSFTATKSTLKEKIKTKYEDIIFDNDKTTTNDSDSDIFSNNGTIFEQNENDIVKLLLGESNGNSKLSSDASLSEQVLVASNYTSTQRNKDMEIDLLKKSSIASTEQLFSTHLDKIIDQTSDNNNNNNDNTEVKDRLFTESTTKSSSSSPPSKPKEPSQESDDASYQYFLNHLGSPQCSDIAQLMRKFLNSVLGPYGDGITPPPPQHEADYIFYGTKKLEKRCMHYFDDMERLIENHTAFKDASDERILSLRDCIERYIFNRISDIAFQNVEVPDDDETLLKKMKILSFLTPDVLDIKPELRNDMIWALARDELKKINSYRTPGEKINCVVKSAGVIMRYLSLEAAKSKECVGADDFLPLFIYVVLHCHVPKLASNCAYIQSFHNPGRLRSKQGYYFVNLQSAIEFVLNVEADMISIDPEVFAKNCAENEKLANIC